MGKLKNFIARSALNLLGVGESGWVDGNPNMPLSISSSVSSSGKSVNAETAMNVSAVWGCVKSTAQLVSTLPLKIYELDRDGNKKPIDHELNSILSISPNSDQTAVEYWEGLIAQLVLQGNGYSEKKFIGSRLVGLSPLFGVTRKVTRSGNIEYSFYDRGQRQILPPEKVFHLRGFGAGNGVGLSAIKYGANSIGSALSADETAGKVFANAMMASGILTSDQTLQTEQRNQLQEMMEKYVGSDKVGKILTLEAGLTYKQLMMNPEDAQLLETRRFNVEDVCRWFGTPPIIIGHSSAGQTMWGSGIEAIMLSWFTTGINPILRKIEARINKDIIPLSKRGKWIAEFDREAMLQMDSKAKAEFLSKMTNNGILSRNEAREKINYSKREGADDLTIQLALAPLGYMEKQGDE